MKKSGGSFKDSLIAAILAMLSVSVFCLIKECLFEINLDYLIIFLIVYYELSRQFREDDEESAKDESETTENSPV